MKNFLTRIKRALRRLATGLGAATLCGFTATASEQTDLVNVPLPALVAATNRIAASTTYTNTVATNGVSLINWDRASIAVTVLPSALDADGTLVLTFVRTQYPNAAGTTSAVNRYASSAATWETGAFLTWTLSLAATNSLTIITNLPTGWIDGVTGLKVLSIQNTATNEVGGITVKVLRKR